MKHSRRQWRNLILQVADYIRGSRRKTVKGLDVLDGVVKKSGNMALAPGAPQDLKIALQEIIEEGNWRSVPKDPARWQPQWRGLAWPEKLIFSETHANEGAVPWHPFLASRGADGASGPMRERLIHMNRYLASCQQRGIEPFNERMGARERSLRIFADEKALDNMKPEGWGRVRLSLDELNCERRSPPVPHAPQKNAPQPPLIVENAETYHSLVAANAVYPTWTTVIYGHGNQSSGQAETIAQLTRNMGHDHIYYFGDVDLRGLRIADTLRSLLAPHGVRVQLSEPLYQLLINENLPVPEKKANTGTWPKDTDWIPVFVTKAMEMLIHKRQRYPQEAVNTALLILNHSKWAAVASCLR